MWQHFKRNVNGTSAEVFAISWHVDDLKVGSLVNSSMYNSNLQGVNGTFYSGSQSVGIAIQNGQAVHTHPNNRNNCLKNGTTTVDRNRGTMYRTTGGTVNVKRTVFAKDLIGHLRNLKWAIGGISMHLDQTLKKAAYDKLIADEAEGVGGVSEKRPRTMMGYNSKTKNIILAIAVDALEHGKTGKGITYYDGRTLMSGLGCTMALHLDGGSSTSIRLEEQEDFKRNIVRHKVTDNAQLTAVYFDTKYGMQRQPSEWTDIWP